MKVVGLTGGVGMGKTACSDFLRTRGLPVVDTDQLARDLVQPGAEALQLIRQEFGPSVITDSGHLDRSALAQVVFRDSHSREKLERILHPRIRQLWRAEVETWRQQGQTLGFVVIPLLFETQAEQELDATVCVACAERTQQARLRARGWTDEQLRQRIASQWPAETKMTRSNFVLWNESSLEILQAQITRVLRSLLG